MNRSYICRICSSPETERFLALGLQPWCNDFITEDEVGAEMKYPLDLYFCKQCTTVQVQYTVPKEVMYNQHLYLSGITRSMREHFQEVSLNVNRYFPVPGLVVDIGSNDGTLLSTYKRLGMDVLGVEPCSKAAHMAIDNGIPTDIAFFNLEQAKNIESRYGKAKVISAANVFYHVEELHDIVKGIKYLLDEDGIFVMQGSYLPRIMEKKAFDIMYHEHLLYYRVETFRYLLNMHNMDVFQIDEAPVHGGSIVAYACHQGKRAISSTVSSRLKFEKEQGYNCFETYVNFAASIEKLRDEIRDLVLNITDQGHTVFAFGAPAKGTVLLNYCGLNRRQITCATEKNPIKIGRYIPGTGIPIVDEDAVKEPDYYLLLSWNFKQEFCQSEAFLSGRRKFIVPIPKPEILTYEQSIGNR